MRICIERFPEYNEKGEIINVSYGCPQFDLMGYTDITELMTNVENMIFIKEVNDVICNEDGSRKKRSNNEK